MADMFRLLESQGEIASAQREFERLVRRAFSTKIKRNIGYPSDTFPNATVYTDNVHWYHSRDLRDEGRPRRLNWFGLYHDGGNLNISVEINVPFSGRSDQIAGFFVQDDTTGHRFLAHSGRVGGGTPGVGKLGFLAYTDQRLFAAYDSAKGTKEGVLVMPLDNAEGVAALLRYVNSIARFKQAARDGETSTTAFGEKVRLLEEYYAEARGRRTGRRRAEIDYMSRHGDVVAALYDWRKSRSQPPSSRIVKNVLIDLGLSSDEKLIEIYEVKSSADRTSIYTAIGQLFVHGAPNNCKRFIVLPFGEALPQGVSDALRRLNIEVLRFRLNVTAATIVS